MTRKRILKFIAFFSPCLIFLWMEQLSSVNKQLAAAGFIICSSLASVWFWRKQSDYTGKSDSSSSGITLASYVSGLIFMFMTMSLCYFFPIGGYLAKPLILDHSTENADAILVLASGATETGEPALSGMQRVNHGIWLLKEGRAKHLYLSTGFSARTGHAESEWVASYTRLFELAPASFSVLVSPEITTTATEAGYARKRLTADGANRILLVTSGAHIYRSCATFRKAGFEVLPAPVHNRKNIFYASENYLTSLQAALHEWFGLILYRMRNRI